MIFPMSYCRCSCSSLPPRVSHPMSCGRLFPGNHLYLGSKAGGQNPHKRPTIQPALGERTYGVSAYKKYSMIYHSPSFMGSNLLTSRKVSWIYFFSSSESPVINGTSSNGIIPRMLFKSHSELRVWVQAKNGNGSAKSPETVFNTADISEIYQQLQYFCTVDFRCLQSYHLFVWEKKMVWLQMILKSRLWF